MRDKEFLQWLHRRLENVHGEDPRADFMGKLRSITEDIPYFKNTTNIVEPPPKFKKAHLKTGMKVILRNGQKYEVLLRIMAQQGIKDILRNADDCINLDNYTNNLEDISHSKEFDIIKVVGVDRFSPIDQEEITLWDRYKD